MLVGEQATVECRVSESDEVAKVSLVIFNGLMQMDMTHQGDGLYQLLQAACMCSEFGYWALPNWASSDKQIRIAEETYKALASRDFIWGATWWLGFDYQTFHTQTNTMGAVTLDRFYRRPVFDRLKELYGQEVHEQ